MSDLAELISFLSLTRESKLSSTPTQTTEQLFQAYLNTKKAAEEWLEKMVLAPREFGYTEDSSERMDIKESL